MIRKFPVVLPAVHWAGVDDGADVGAGDAAAVVEVESWLVGNVCWIAYGCSQAVMAIAKTEKHIAGAKLKYFIYPPI